jgi:hypothetical protein
MCACAVDQVVQTTKALDGVFDCTFQIIQSCQVKLDRHTVSTGVATKPANVFQLLAISTCDTSRNALLCKRQGDRLPHPARCPEYQGLPALEI